LQLFATNQSLNALLYSLTVTNCMLLCGLLTSQLKRFTNLHFCLPWSNSG